MAQRRKTPSPPDLNGTFELLALQIGDRIGERLARALDRPAGDSDPSDSAPAMAKRRCEREGCERPVAAKGLCKSHYNLVLYHRRKAQTASAGKPAKGKSGRRAPGDGR